MRDPLGRESLDLFDGVLRGILEERSNKVQSLVVRQMRGWVFFQALLVQVLQPAQTEHELAQLYSLRKSKRISFFSSKSNASNIISVAIGFNIRVKTRW